MTSLYAAALVPFRGFRLGPMRLTTYGACAAAGVIAGMALSARAARQLQLDPEAAWDAGMFAIVSCFLASRLLLVLSDPHAFARFPILVLSLPSLTIGGIALAALASLLYLRRKRVPVLALLDAFAPCGALLAAFLELGHALDGSEPGMPLAGHASGPDVRLVPVSLYGAILSVCVFALLWLALRKDLLPGQVAALGLVLGGLAAFGLTMLSLPTDLLDEPLLEPGQYVALGAMLAGGVLWTFAPKYAVHLNLERTNPATPGQHQTPGEVGAAPGAGGEER